MAFKAWKDSRSAGYSRPGPSKTGSAGRIGVSARDIKDLKLNFEMLGEEISDGAIKVAANIVIDLLSRSQPKVPFVPDSGLLRKSGEARILLGHKHTKGKSGYTKLVAKGRKDGNVDVDVSGLKGLWKRRPSYIRGNVTYDRLNETGEDIAVWTHEELLPYEARPLKPAARQPGTGPKYLESTWLDKRDEYIAWIKDEFSRQEVAKDIERNLKVVKKGGKYTVDILRTKKRR